MTQAISNFGARWLRGAMYAVLTLAAAGARPAWSAPPLTIIQDTLYRADGALYSGYVQIEWKSFEASDNTIVPAQSVNLRVYNGQFKTQLVPTTNASAGAIYTVRYVSDGRIHAVENWAVPPATVAIRVTAVRVPPGQAQTPGATGTQTVEISDVVGLQEALDIRPRKGTGYTPGRTAIISSLGELEGALGADSDCITVEGAGATCGNTNGTISFVDGDVVSGPTDGTNPNFTLTHPPNPVSSLLLYRNGLLQRQGVDFSISGKNITFLSGAIPRSGDILVASYRLSGSGSAAPQILCSSVGSSTSVATATSLGTCTVPASVLNPGERVEIWADFSHQGVLQPFTVSAKWGATTVGSRIMAASETNATFRISLGVHTANTVYGTESWGATEASQNTAGSIAVSYSTPLTIDFSGNLGASSADSVTLRNYTVIRYPVP